jgi:23S rRNA pseudouridine1911/1915/1917 synthase
MKKMTTLSFLESETLESFLIEGLGFSKQSIKKVFSKKERERFFKSRDIVTLPLNFLNHHFPSPSFTGHEKPLFIEGKNGLFALNKPPQVHSLALEYSEGDNAVSFLRDQLLENKHFKAAIKTQWESKERGLLHRLDYETSGVLLFAESEKTFQDFSEMNVQKWYLAIADGLYPPEKKEDLWECRDSLMTNGGVRVEVDLEQKYQKNAHAFFIRLEENKEKQKTLLLIRLVSGLRHQIRVQSALRGLPLEGDPLYHPDGHQSGERLYLHSYCYQVEEQSFCATETFGLLEHWIKFSKKENKKSLIQLIESALLNFNVTIKKLL